MLTKVISLKALFEEEIRAQRVWRVRVVAGTWTFYLYVRMMLLRVVDYLSFFISSLSL